MVTEPQRMVRWTRTPGGRIRVLVVDDSLVIRHLVKEALKGDPELEVVGAESDGAAALARISILKPDVLTLDIEMPTMDGLETLRQLRALYPHMRTIMFSTLTTRGASKTFEALSLGADDYVAKASNSGSLDKSLASLRAELIPKIKQFFALPTAAPKHVEPTPPPTLAAPKPRTGRPEVIAIGVSTGGPQALARVIPKLPANLACPVVVVQHMPAMFTRLLAERLDAESQVTVLEAVDGMPLQPGVVLLAPGDYHLKVRRAAGNSLVASLDQAPHENSCRPSVDVLYRSLAESVGPRTLAVMLTGMGSDGLKGTRALKDKGATCIAQDQATSVVWGMPGAVVEAGLADRVLALDQIAVEVAFQARA